MLSRYLSSTVRRAVTPFLIHLLARINRMTTKQDLLDAVASLKTGDAANKATLAAFEAQAVADQATIADLQARLTISQAATVAAQAAPIDDSVVSDIKTVAADLTPPAPPAPPAAPAA